MSAPLTTLTDREIMMNLWLGMIIILQDTQIDPADVVQSLCRIKANQPHEDEAVSLSDVITEAERRLSIEVHNITSEEMRLS